MTHAKRLVGKEPSSIFPYLGEEKAQTTVNREEGSLEEDIVENPSLESLLARPNN